MTRRISLLSLLAMLIAFAGCGSREEKRMDAGPQNHYLKAADLMKKNDPQRALQALELAFKEGSENPMEVVMDSIFYPLVDDPGHRRKLRELLLKYSKSAEADMRREAAPGEAIEIRGKVVEEGSGQGISDALVELVHTNVTGIYFDDDSTWNPRIFAYLRTDDKGEFRVSTIRPGQYLDDEGMLVPSHVHFNIQAEGYRPYGSEFTFEDDSVFVANGNEEQVPVARLVQSSEDRSYVVEIPLQGS